MLIVANGAYSRLNSFSIMFCCMIEPNRSTWLVISFVTLRPMVAISKIINYSVLVRGILDTFGLRFI